MTRHFAEIVQLLKEFDDNQIDFALEMEAYETERVEAKKE